MKRTSLLASALFCIQVLSWSQAGPEGLKIKLNEDVFETFVHQVQEQTEVRVFYKTEWFEGLSFTFSADSVSLNEAINQLLKGTGLHYQLIDEHRLLVLPDGRLQLAIPALSSQEFESGQDISGEEQVSEYGTEFLRGTRAEHIPQVVVVGEESLAGRSSARVKGKLINMENGEPVLGATMVELESGKGAVSDQNGNVTMALVPGRHQVRFSFIGLESVELTLDVMSDGEFQLQMRPAMIAIDEVQIMGQQYRQINTTEIGVERFSMNSLKQVPVFMGERDVIKISKLLPGITSAGEASVGVNVRGGNVDQNIFYINRVPIYNTSHLFGFFSAFNSDIIREFSIYKGNVPVNYGGRLSSVFNIHSRKGNKKQYTAHAGISPISAHATVEGPIRKGKSSFLVSGRSSYSDWILNKMEDPNLRNSDAFFYDFTGALNFQPNTKNEFNLFYYQSYDHFKYTTLSDYEYANRGASISWEKYINPALTSTLTGTLSNYSFGHVEKSEVSGSYSHDYLLNHNELTLEFSWVPGLKHKLEFGGNAILYRLDRGEVNPYGDASIWSPVDLGFEEALEGSLFLSDNIQILPWLSLYAGLRYSFYSKLGPQTVMLYEEGKPKSQETVNDSIVYDNFEPITFHSGPEARAALNIKLGPNTSLKLSFNQMRQYLFMLSNTVTISPTDQWKLSDYHINPQSSIQYTGGIYRVFPRTGISASMELYYKEASDIVEYKDGVDFVRNPYTETLVLQGDQRAYGAEFMLQKSTGRLDGWISYTLSRSEMLVEGELEGESINHGNPYPSNFDRPHVLNVVANYDISRRFSISSNMVYMSGRPITYPTSLYYINHVAYVDYFARNGFRIPDYFRIDLSLNIEGNLKAKKAFHSTWSFNVYNLLGRNNPQSIYFTPHEYFVQGWAFSVIGTPIFTISWNVKLGNYESQ